VFLGGVGAHQAEHPVGFVGVGGPDFLAVDEEVIVVHFGFGGQRRQVGAGVGLGVALAPADLAARDLPQVMALLFFAAVFEQRRAEHPDAEALQRHAALEGRHFLAQDRGLGVIQAAAAVRARPHRHGPAALAHALEPLALRLALVLEALAAPADVAFGLGGLPHFAWAVGFEPGARFAPEGLEIGGGFAHDFSFARVQASTPPSQMIVCPVVKLDALEARYTAAPAISSGSPMRRNGDMRVARSSVSGFSQSARAKSVRTRPGAMQFTRTLCGPYSTA